MRSNIGSNRLQKKRKKKENVCNMRFGDANKLKRGKKITKKHEGQSVFADLCVGGRCSQVERLDWWRQGGWPRDPSDKTPDLAPINYPGVGWAGTAAGQEDIHSHSGMHQSHFGFWEREKKLLLCLLKGSRQDFNPIFHHLVFSFNNCKLCRLNYRKKYLRVDYCILCCYIQRSSALINW